LRKNRGARQSPSLLRCEPFFGDRRGVAPSIVVTSAHQFAVIAGA
jgi:hypothetical protein